MKRVPYVPPSWAASLSVPKAGRVPFAALPTPVMQWACPALSDLGVEWWIKRDDCSGVEMSGNKARKLEFLMAEALDGGHDCVVTIGGLQSNHCRATAAAARQVGLEPHLVLLVRDKDIENEVGMTGNLMVERMLGARLHLCAASDYLRYGGDLAAMDKLNAAAAAELAAGGRRPYVVPVGGTTPVGTWGYIKAVEELCEQLAQPPASGGGTPAPPPFDHVVVAAGSGGTAAGLALGMRLSPLSASLHAVNVQHSSWSKMCPA
jgi:D-cysteine desulfhydrase